ncbi:hypothetical protein [Neptuniibacter sp.]|uniref:hypothetical protein n=1 Tax=Neptuniibacter sp. TaxID=1962643 RepID=UPI00261FAA70|nr:hypothetical protein [Neptuniibacter sp.]MCP4597022.1 hypothetical protein [Neptuniibacter sp.]
MAGEKNRDMVLNGSKTVTIREGERACVCGPVLIGCPELGWCVLKNIISVKHTTMDNIFIDDVWKGGHRTEDGYIEELKQYYPDFNEYSVITVIEWEDK